MDLFMVVVLVLISILGIYGTLYNRRTNNKAGFVIGGLFTLGIVGVTLLAVVDLFFGL